MSRELDFINFIDDLAESEGRDIAQEVKLPSNRDLITNAIANIDDYPNEKDVLLKYKNTMLKLSQSSGTVQTENLENELQKLEEKLQDVIAAENRKAFSVAVKKGLKEIERLRAIYDSQKNNCSVNPESLERAINSSAENEAKKSERAYIYATAANGMEVRIPTDRYEQWKAAQDRIRQGQTDNSTSDTAKCLAELMKGKKDDTSGSQSTPARPAMNNVPAPLLFCVIASVVTAALYFIGMADLAYGYYTFLRVFSLISLPIIVLVYIITTGKINTPMTYVPSVIWILFNPIFPIYLDKDTWVVLDLICGIAMIACAIYVLIAHAISNHTKQ
ncbi:MAG: hypothetical protein IKB47_00935 [Clostridia bacterium]|nr:hypothetical protein [Clostridia bacterium]